MVYSNKFPKRFNVRPIHAIIISVLTMMPGIIFLVNSSNLSVTNRLTINLICILIWLITILITFILIAYRILNRWHIISPPPAIKAKDNTVKYFYFPQFTFFLIMILLGHLVISSNWASETFGLFLMFPLIGLWVFTFGFLVYYGGMAITLLLRRILQSFKKGKIG